MEPNSCMGDGDENETWASDNALPIDGFDSCRAERTGTGANNAISGGTRCANRKRWIRRLGEWKFNGHRPDGQGDADGSRWHRWRFNDGLEPDHAQLRGDFHI